MATGAKSRVFLVKWGREEAVFAEDEAQAVWAIKRKHWGAKVQDVELVRGAAKERALKEADEVIAAVGPFEQCYDLSLTKHQIQTLREAVSALFQTLREDDFKAKSELHMLDTAIAMGWLNKAEEGE